MPAARILLVDDQRETSRMLRMMLEYLNRGYVIVDVPSGEEAILEVRRGPFDLLITDVRLPGISGLELVARMRQANPGGRVIIISGLADPDLREAAQALNADAFFAKPIDSDRFLETVQAMLGGDLPPAPGPPSVRAAAPAEVEGEAEATQISGRLARLRRDLGALAVILADPDGRVVMSAGDAIRLDVKSLLNHLMVTFSAAQYITALLGDEESAHVQFFDGKNFDLYTLNVGQSFLLVVAFEGERGARAMGPVINYGRPAAADLAAALASLGVEEPAVGHGTGPLKPPTGPLAAAEPLPVAEPALAELLQAGAPPDADAFWEAAVAEAAADEVDVNSLSYEQAQTLGLLPREE
jgi:CheY-like chemotaxis protein